MSGIHVAAEAVSSSRSPLRVQGRFEVTAAGLRGTDDSNRGSPIDVDSGDVVSEIRVLRLKARDVGEDPTRIVQMPKRGNADG